MNRKLRKQIKVYAGVAGTMIISGRTDGQILYHDIIPDTVIDANPANSGWHNYDLDVDNDSIIDFELKTLLFTSTNGSNSSQVIVHPFNNNQVLKNSFPNCIGNSGSSYWPSRLFQGLLINSNGMWESYPQHLCEAGNTSGGNGYACGPWINHSGYLAFRLFKNSCYNYGWIRLSVNWANKFTIMDYAYNTICNDSILAGDSVTSTVDVRELIISFQFIQQNNLIKIISPHILNHAIISVYDLLGKEILNQPFEGKEATITLDKKGIYFVEVKSERGIFRKKVFIY